MAQKRAAQERIREAIANWLKKLQEYPEWQEWKHSHIEYTLYFDDGLTTPQRPYGDVNLPPEIEKERALILSYLEIQSTANALHDVEWYFRRYPFSRAPVTLESHLKYSCEMFFGRFYQFKERLKILSKNVNNTVPNSELRFGEFIKEFNKEFKQEIQARHSIHHHEAFDELAISRITILELTALDNGGELQNNLYQSHYRQTAKEWAARTRRRAEKLDQFVEAVADALLKVCPFLIIEKT